MEKVQYLAVLVSTDALKGTSQIKLYKELQVQVQVSKI